MLSGGSEGAEIIRFLNMTFMIKIRTRKLWKIMNINKNGLKSLSNGPNFMTPGLGGMKIPQISVSTWKFWPKPSK